MAAYRYVGGSVGQILDTPYIFKTYGQLVDLPEDLAEKVIHEGRLSLLPAAEFDALKFTPEELTKYSKFHTHNSAPDSFKAKRDAAWEKVVSNREEKLATEPKPVESTVGEPPIAPITEVK